MFSFDIGRSMLDVGRSSLWIHHCKDSVFWLLYSFCRTHYGRAKGLLPDPKAQVLNGGIKAFGWFISIFQNSHLLPRKGVSIFFLKDISWWFCPARVVPCRIDDVSPVSFYYQPASFHLQSGGHKTRLRLICLLKKIWKPPGAEGHNSNISGSSPKEWPKRRIEANKLSLPIYWHLPPSTICLMVAIENCG